MQLLVIWSDGSEERMNLTNDSELLVFVVGGFPKSVPYSDDFVLVYSDEANKARPNRITVGGKKFFGAVAIMKGAEYERIVHG